MTLPTHEEVKDAVRTLLRFVGEDPAREGLRDTPQRVLRAWQEWTSGYVERAADHLKVFEDGAEHYDELVLVREIPVQSMCEHHLAPFHGVAHVAYIPSGRVVGLSKLARVVNTYARRLQVQERLTQQIAHALDEHLKPSAVGVVLSCEHTCMSSRGVRIPASRTVTSCLLGAFKNEPSARAEFLRLAYGS